ncbi:hypothetical protein ACI68E_002982 [Malassezia pachydermatis]|uniref:G-patch domain-containing protein n=1 Tax=Malassezia pachydermatis TaxID=77020 RepID=A0A0M8MM43_9BASI|nr:hypothetical protein Malapachy_3812 [Malassezia pachydermatis]KOS14328.1 hypothetical protein Malapachy_3812 [Malassezia pachydermatis]
MPLNTSEYLTKQGWSGHGTPLDGERGRGLRKPIIIPQKRNLGGVGQNRDRAVEWWDDIFAAGAKALAIGPAAKKETTPTNSNVPRRALSTLAKQEHARRMLMSNFIRGEVVSSMSLTEEMDEETNVVSITCTATTTETTQQAPGSIDDTRTSAIVKEVDTDTAASTKKKKSKSSDKKKAKQRDEKKPSKSSKEEKRKKKDKKDRKKKKEKKAQKSSEEPTDTLTNKSKRKRSSDTSGKDSTKKRRKEAAT